MAVTRWVGIARFINDGGRMQRIYFQVGVSVALVLDRQFTNGNFGNGRGERPTPDMVAFFPPQSTGYASCFEFIKGGSFV